MNRLTGGNSWIRKGGGSTVFCAGKDDTSPVMVNGKNGRYSEDCPCCYLNFGHTIDYHNQQVEKGVSK
jgi:hypothetical protein